MKACVLHGIGDLRLEDVSAPTPKAGEALIAVRACGVCGSDVPRVFSKGTYHFPTIPGHEFAGEIADVGPGEDKSLIGKRVAVFPLIPCGKCPPCEIGAYAQCVDYDYLGSRSDGAFAEYVCAPIWNLLPAPDAISFAEAAMVEPAAVAAHALRKAGIDIGDIVLIFGAGPIGVMLAMWARAWGASETLLADVDDRKLEFARSLGFNRVANPIKEDLDQWLRETASRGADVVLEASGSSAAFEQCMTSARTFGKVVLMGNPAGEMRLTQKAYWAILRNELQVFGTWNSSFSNLPKNEWALSLDWMASGKLDVKPLISHRVSLDGLSDALVMMRDRTTFFNKVICEPRGA